MSDEIDKLNKMYHGYIKLPGEEYKHPAGGYIPTGSIGLDLLLGERGRLCGVPRGLVTSFWGREGAGKSTLVASCMAQAQAYGLVAFANTELRFDPEYFARIGVDINQLTVIDLNYYNGVFGEQIGQAIINLAKTGDYSMIVCDSMAALTPKRIAESEVGESNPGLRARLIKEILEKVISPIKRNNVAMLFTSHRSANFGAVGFGTPKTMMVGGNAVKFYSSVLGRIDYIGKVLGSRESKKEPIGIETKVTLQKNVGISWGSATFKITDGLGIDVSRELISYDEVVYRRGAYYYYGDADTGEEMKLAQGELNAVDELRNNSDLLNSLIDRQRRILDPPKESHDELVVEP